MKVHGYLSSKAFKDFTCEVIACTGTSQFKLPGAPKWEESRKSLFNFSWTHYSLFLGLDIDFEFYWLTLGELLQTTLHQQEKKCKHALFLTTILLLFIRSKLLVYCKVDIFCFKMRYTCWLVLVNSIETSLSRHWRSFVPIFMLLSSLNLFFFNKYLFWHFCPVDLGFDLELEFC